MVHLLIVLCSAVSGPHGSACHRIDPMYAAMSALVCNMRQMQLAEVWAALNPELLRGRRIARTMCVPVNEVQVQA